MLTSGIIHRLCDIAYRLIPEAEASSLEAVRTATLSLAKEALKESFKTLWMVPDLDKISRIKLHRAGFGSTLVDAKNAVETFLDQNPHLCESSQQTTATLGRAHTGDWWDPGEKAMYLDYDLEIAHKCEIVKEVEGWWEVKFSDDSTSIVRPSRLHKPKEPSNG